MADKELKVSISLDRSGAKSDAQAFRSDQNALNAALLADQRRAENAKVAAARSAQQAIAGASKSATAAVRVDFQELGKAGQSAFDKVRGAAGSLFSSQGVGFAVAEKGLEKLIGLAFAYGDAIKASQDKYQQMTSRFVGQRESLGQLANLMGREADDKFVLDMARFNKATGFRPDEGRKYLETLYNEGAAYKGVKISDKEFGELAEQGGQMALARGVDPSAVANMLGRQLGFKDYSKFGEQASEEVLGDTTRALSVLSAGSGEEGKLIEEVNKLSASMLSEDETRGVFHDNTDVAKYVSILASGFPREQAEAGAAGIRSLRGFDKKRGGAFLSAAGVTPADDPFTAIKKVGDYATEQAKLGPEGTTAQDVLTQSFEDSLGARAIGTSYGIGVQGGQFEQREEVAAREGGPDKALAKNAAFLRSKRGLSREADADQALLETEMGAKNADLDILRKQSITRMMRSGELDKPTEKVKDFLANNMFFGLIGDAEKRRIDQDVWEQLQRRTPAGVLPPDTGEIIGDPQILEQKLTGRIHALEDMGLDPYHDKAAPEGPPAAAAPSGGRPAWAADADAHQAEMVRLLGQIASNSAPPVQPPAPGVLVGPPAVATRD